MKLGIMQGRLVPPEPGRFQSFPRQRWRDEFALAAAAGLDTIEWIYDAYGEDVNPLSTDAGLTELQALSSAHGIGVESVCADWFMDFPLLRVDPPEAGIRWKRLGWLIERCAEANIKRIVLPFVDVSAIQSSTDREEIIAGVGALSDLLDRVDVELHLETSLGPESFASLLSAIGHSHVKVNYDSGNSASLGFKPADEFAHYGRSVGSVHIKDRVLNGATVPLGEGDADFTTLFSVLDVVGYHGDFILQVARGGDGDELEWARQNAATARGMINRLTTTQDQRSD